MVFRLHAGTLILLACCVGAAQGIADEQSPAERADALHHHGLDPVSSLESRVTQTPATVLKMFTEAGQPTPTAHTLTAVEQRKLSTAFATLPPLHRRILGERLRSVSFLDGMPNTALTSTVNPEEPYRLFDITIRAAVLGEDVSEFLTQKERTCFDTTGSSLSVSIETGQLDAIVYVLLHEATHVRLKLPYRIVIRHAGQEVFAYEPMKSDIVRNRFDQMNRFY